MSKRLQIRILKDKISSRIMLFYTVLIILLFILITTILLLKSSFILSKNSVTDLLFSSQWDPEIYNFGFFPAVVGTLIVTIISMAIAIPISLLSAILIAEYTPKKGKKILSSFIDVLAGVPSVVFGLCALLYLAPFVSRVAERFFHMETTGMNMFTASLTLAIMVFPIIISLSIESLQAVPVELREVSLSLGATKWQTVKKVLFRAAGPGIISAVLLGFGRAFGETMAVAMIIGNKNQIPGSILEAGQTLPSLIVSSFGEMMSIPLQQSALIFVALTLFVIVTVTNTIAKIVNNKLANKWRY
jgi:phosphate transport system permease protein